MAGHARLHRMIGQRPRAVRKELGAGAATDIAVGFRHHEPHPVDLFEPKGKTGADDWTGGHMQQLLECLGAAGVNDAGCGFDVQPVFDFQNKVRSGIEKKISIRMRD